MAEIDPRSLEPNSYKYRAEKAKKEAEKQSRPKLDPVVDKNSVISTKKSFGKKVLGTFLTEDAKTLKDWLLMDVLVPGIKETILNLISMSFFGEYRSRDRRNYDRGYRGDSSRYDYRGCYRGNVYDRENYRRDSGRNSRYDHDDRVDFRNIVLRQRSDAERVIRSLRGRIRDYGSASVAELLDLVDLSGDYTDNNYGWVDERDVGIRQVSGGFLIDVAEPRYLD